MGNLFEYLTIISCIRRCAGSCIIISSIRSCPLLKTVWIAVKFCVAAAWRYCSIMGWGKGNHVWIISIACSAYSRQWIFMLLKVQYINLAKNYSLSFNFYPNMPSSRVALYWEGISIRAERANSVCFLDRSTFFDMISVKFTNCIKETSPSELRTCKNHEHIKLAIFSRTNWHQNIADHLKIIECSSRDVIVEFPHHVPRAISNPH